MNFQLINLMLMNLKLINLMLMNFKLINLMLMNLKLINLMLMNFKLINFMSMNSKLINLKLIVFFNAFWYFLVLFCTFCTFWCFFVLVKSYGKKKIIKSLKLALWPHLYYYSREIRTCNNFCLIFLNCYYSFYFVSYTLFMIFKLRDFYAPIKVDFLNVSLF